MNESIKILFCDIGQRCFQINWWRISKIWYPFGKIFKGWGGACSSSVRPVWPPNPLVPHRIVFFVLIMLRIMNCSVHRDLIPTFHFTFYFSLNFERVPVACCLCWKIVFSFVHVVTHAHTHLILMNYIKTEKAENNKQTSNPCL